jgi:rhamnosyltransferase subunit B
MTNDTNPMIFLLVPIGSHGDVHPFVGIGIRLRRRGHRVKVIANPHFESLVRGAGLEFVPISSDAEYRQIASDPRLWHRMKGPPLVFKAMSDLNNDSYRAIAQNLDEGHTTVVGSSMALGARVAAEKFGLPGVTVHLQPLCFRSNSDSPKFAGMLLGRRVPRWLVALQWAVIDNLILDRLAGPPLNSLRAELGLPKVKGIARQYWNSPQRVIGLFPDWYAPPQPDWPAQARLTGFPLYDERGVTPLSSDLQQFLDSGTPPIAFTFGSAMWHAQKILQTCVRACEMIGRRGILLTRHGDQVPRDLPPGVIHVDFAPFSELLPRCAALVHHGGIGTASQGLAAGVPQLVMPHAHDQPDNAARLVRLGVAKKLEPRQFRAKRVARELSELLQSHEIAQSCKEVAARFAGHDPLEETCDLIEQVAIQNGSPRIHGGTEALLKS